MVVQRLNVTKYTSGIRFVAHDYHVFDIYQLIGLTQSSRGKERNKEEYGKITFD